MPETGAVLVRKNGNDALIFPASESSRASIFSVKRCNSAAENAACCSSINATKRDMCVPFWSAGRKTVMVSRATVDCSPLWLWMRMGKRKSLIPTWSMGILRKS